jgi:hypothetical protein
MMRTARADEIGKYHAQHLLDRAAHLLGQPGPLRAAASQPLPHERLDVLGKILHRACAANVGELTERDHHRHPAQHAPGSITLPVEPDHVTLDLGSDPARPDTIDRRRLDEVRLQHGNFLSTSRWRKHHHATTTALCAPNQRQAAINQWPSQ